MVVIAVLGGVVLLSAVDDRLSGASNDILTDKSEMATTTRQLDAVRNMLAVLPTYPNATAEHAQREACSIDSGDLFQPSVHQYWKVRGNTPEPLERAVRGDLTKRGWKIPAATDKFGNRTVSFDSKTGWTAIVRSTEFRRTISWVWS